MEMPHATTRGLGPDQGASGLPLSFASLSLAGHPSLPKQTQASLGLSGAQAYTEGGQASCANIPGASRLVF